MSRNGLVHAYRNFHAAAATTGRLKRRASAPLLVNPSGAWFRSEKRLLIVGQETNGWGSPDGSIRTLHDFHLAADAVDVMLSAYTSFDFAAGYAHRNSAFWRAFRFVAEEHAALWTNLFRADMNGPVVLNCTADEQCHLLQSQSALFRQEVSELAPTTIIFMTGPRYDNALRTIYQGCALVPLWADVSEREVALVREDRLPVRSIRIYHPTYLQRARRWHLLVRLRAWLRDD